MTDDADRAEPDQVIEEARHHRLEDAKKSYEQAINRLWAGNAAGMFAVLGAVATGKTQGASIIIALSAFGLGLLLLGIGAFCSLLSQTKVIRELEQHNSLLDVTVTSVQSPSEEAGLTFRNVQTVMGVLSAILFFVGAVCGLYYAVRW